MTTTTDTITTALVPVIDLPFLAGEINDAHRQAGHHLRSMLLEAQRAGQALLRAKALVPHGQFQAWVEANCRCSYRSAAEYMQVARLGKTADLRTFDGGVRAFLEAHGSKKSIGRTTRKFTPDDAERALKLRAVAERGTEHEKVVAADMLEAFAQAFGMTAQQAVARAEGLLPWRHLSPDAAKREEADHAAWRVEMEAEYQRCRREDHQRRRNTWAQKLTSKTHAELLWLLADACIRFERAGMQPFEDQ